MRKLGKPFYRYEYTGYHGCDCVCDLEVYGNLVIATERGDNTGTSITNMAERLAIAICQQFDIAPGKLIWIERYTAESYEDRDTEDERLSLVQFNLNVDGFWVGKRADVKFTNPRWIPIEPLVLQALIETHKEVTSPQ